MLTALSRAVSGALPVCLPLLLVLVLAGAARADDPPVANATATPSTVEGKQPIILDGTGSTDDVGIVDYRWAVPDRLYTFDGTAIDPEWKWTGSVSQSNRLIVTGGNTWGADNFYNPPLRARRGATLECRVDTGTGGHAMVGFKDLSTTTWDYRKLRYSLYFNNGGLNVYESGNYRGAFATYTLGQSYDIRIVTKAGAGADYYWRASGSGNPYALVWSSPNDSSTEFSVGADVHSGTWGFDNMKVDSIGLSGSLLQTKVPGGGTVTLTVTDGAAQTDSATITIASVTGNPPNAAFSGPATTTAGSSASFDPAASTDDYGIFEYSWDFGDGSTVSSHSGNPAHHFYGAPGTYQVTLTVKDYADQTDTATHSLTVTGSSLVKAVPWKIVGGVELPHETWSGRTATLKAVAGHAAVPVNYTWDFGDGSPTVSGTASNTDQAYDIQATHVYTGTDGTPFTATITVRDANGVTATDTYPVLIRPKSLEVEINVAIDDGLWYLHRNMTRTTIDGTQPGGYWSYSGYLSAPTGSAIQSFGINGHRLDGDGDRDPYVETVTRAVNYQVTLLQYVGIGPQTYGDPDTNSNGIALTVGPHSRQCYELGQTMDGLIAAVPPEWIAQVGGVNVKGRPYRDLVQDMVDMYCWGQTDYTDGRGGGWRYSWNSDIDNSAAQWGAIGCKAAEEVWNLPAPQWVKDRNMVWLRYSNYQWTSGANQYGGFGYTNRSYGWATTPSGMVQLAWNGIPRTDAMWWKCEDWIADNWSSYASQNNLYAMYALTKCLRLQSPPVTQLAKTGKDWFLDNTNGFARLLVSRQYADGHFYDSVYVGHGPLATAWGINILSSSLFREAPVAVAHAQPNPAAAGIDIDFDATASYHQDPTFSIVEYLWDFDASDGIDFDSPDATGPTPKHAYGNLGTYNVTLQIKDNNTPPSFDTATLVMQVTIPPHPPTANAGGPYVAAVGEDVKFDGAGSFDIDQAEGDSITAWDWETDFVHPLDFNDGVAGVTATWAGGPGAAGTFDIGLRVTDDTAAKFPQSGSPNLTDDDFTTLVVYPLGISDLYVRPKGTKVQLVWSHLGGNRTYQVFRSTAGPNQGFVHIASTQSTYSTFLDTELPLGTTFYYRVLVFDTPSTGAPLGDPVGSSGTVGVTTSSRDRDRNRIPRFTSVPPTTAYVGREYIYEPTCVDAEQQTLTYNLGAGPAGMSCNSSTCRISFTPTLAQLGVHDVFLEAWDPLGGLGTQFYQLVVEMPPNTDPVAVANGPHTIVLGNAVFLSSAGSHDPDGDPITYSWNFGDGNTSTDQNPAHTYSAAGFYVVTLFVSDDRGGTHSTQTAVQVDEPNQVPVSVIDGPAEINIRLGAEITLDGTNSYDPDGDPLTHTWQWGDSTPADTTDIASHTYGAMGTFHPSLTVDDGRGGLHVTNVTVNVGPENEPPIAVIDITQFGEEIGEEFIFDGSASSDPEGDLIALAWDFGDGTGTTGEIVSHAFATGGDFVVTLFVEDEYGAVTEETVTVSVNAPPVFTSSPGGTVDENELYTYIAFAVDPEGEAVTLSLEAGPDGMTLDPATGEVLFTPDDDQVGDHGVTLRATDPNGAFSEQSFTLTVVEVNDVPGILPPPASGEYGYPGQLYTYQVQATDPDPGSVLTYALVAPPSGMTIGLTTGLISWTPTAGQLGLHTITVHVIDGFGPPGVLIYQLTVTFPDVAVPDVTGLAQAHAEAAIVGASLTLGTVTTANHATVPAGDVISQSPAAGILVANGTPVDLLVSLGPVMTTVPDVVGQTQASAETAILVASLTVGTVTITNHPTVPDGEVLSQSPVGGSSAPENSPVHLVVSAGPGAPDDEPPFLAAWMSSPTGSYPLGGPAVVMIDAGDNSGIVNLSIAVDGGPPLPATQGGNSVWTGVGTPGSSHTVVVTATDAASNAASKTLFYGIADPTDTTPPTATILEPANDMLLTGVTNVTGIASDTRLLGWKLEFAPIGTTAWSVFATGTTPVLAGVLGQFDPTLLNNGQYAIRLTVTDCNGASASATVTVYVEGDLKLGQFWVSFKDKNLDIGAFPLQVHRNYDSRRRAVPGDFGYGWSLGLSEAELTLNMPPGQGWAQSTSGGFLTTYTLYAPRPQIATVKLGREDDEQRRFVAAPSPTSQVLFPIEWITGMSFNPLSGTVGALVPLGQSADVYLSGQILDFNFDLYNPPGYRYTAPDGWQYVFSRTSGGAQGLRQTLSAITDPNGTTMQISSTGIQRSDGLGLSFVKDGSGRITQLTDPKGNVTQYAYDIRGDLASVTDPEGNVTRFVYDSGHYLLKIIDPLGRPVQRQEYDEDGRLISITDAAGETVLLEYNVGANTQIVRDRRNNPVIYEYDAAGNVVMQTEFPEVDGAVAPVTIARTYGSTGDLLTETDQRGYTRTCAYDSRGNVLTRTDALGNVELFTYNSQNQVLTHTDKRGNITVNVYDALGRLVSRTSRDGGVTTWTYDSRGNVLGMTDALGNTTTYTYDPHGRKLSETNALGHTTTYTYDANANRLTETDPLGHVTTFEYDGRDLMIAKTNALGHRTEFVHDAKGTRIATIDPLGHRTEQTMDDRGDVIRTDYPDGTFTTGDYDADGNRTSATNRDGSTTTYEYDALDRLTRVTAPDTTVRELRYDAAGNLIGEIDEAGNRTNHEYDAVGRRTRTVVPTGDDTTYAYDPNGNRVSLDDANGHLTTYTFDAMDRLTDTMLPDGTTVNVTHDLLGRATSKRDPSGFTTSYTYDAVGNLISVTDPLGGGTQYVYDAVGNRTAVQDANGHTTLFEYDAIGRQTARQLPGGQRETFSYDAADRQTGHVDFNGATHAFTYDEVGRQLTATYADGTTITKTYTGGGEPLTVEDGRGTTVNTYDSRGRLLTTTDPAGRATTWTWTTRGEAATVTTPTGNTTSYSYDSLNRLSTTTDPNGGVTTYTYDGVGNLLSAGYPNGTSAQYTYNARNQLVQLVNRRSDASVISSFDYILDNRGLRTQVLEAGGGIVHYTYDGNARVLSETRTGANAFTATYTYDPVGNRLSVNRGGTITSSTYDANDRLLTAGTTTFSYDSNGNLTQQVNGAVTTYSYDSLNRLVHTQAPAAVVTRYVYDADGNRVATLNGTGGILAEYLLDVRSRTGVAQVLEELDGAGVSQVHYTYGADLISQRRNGTRLHYHYDGLGSTRELTNATETVTDTYLYDAYGRGLASTGTTVNHYQFAGEQFDPAVGFYYLRARYYTPEQGRFVSMDPERGDPQAPISLHRYLYAANNPVNFIDPTGRMTLVSVMVSISINTNIRSIYTKNLISFFAQALRIVYCSIKPGYEMRDAGLMMVANNIPGGFKMYSEGMDMIAKGFQAIGSEIRTAYRNMANDIISVKSDVLDAIMARIDDLRSGRIPPAPGAIGRLQRMGEAVENGLQAFADALIDIDAVINGSDCERFTVIAKRISLITDRIGDF